MNYNEDEEIGSGFGVGVDEDEPLEKDFPDLLDEENPYPDPDGDK